MNDKPISVGDVVVVLREHCPTDGVLGAIGKVMAIHQHNLVWLHCKCGAAFDAGGYHAELAKDSYHPVAWLKRIPPLDQLEVEKRDEKLTEPA